MLGTTTAVGSSAPVGWSVVVFDLAGLAGASHGDVASALRLRVAWHVRADVRPRIAEREQPAVLKRPRRREQSAGVRYVIPPESEASMAVSAAAGAAGWIGVR